MNKIKFGGGALIVILLASCATVQKVDDAVIANPKIVGNVAALIMKFVPIPENDKVATANDVYAICSIIRSLENPNQLASPDEFSNQLASAVAENGKKYESLIGIISGAYSLAFPEFNGDTQRALNTIESLAQAGEVYAKNILNQ